VAVSANALAAAPAANNAALQWNEALLQAIRITHPGPPIVARALFVAHTCMYDAWAAYSHEALGTQHGALLRQPKRARTRNNKTQAISNAAYRAAETSTPAGIGNTACAAVLAFRHADGANQLGDLHAGAYFDKAQVDEVLAYSAGLTDRQKVIAEYWADGPSSELPPGHWNLFAQVVSRRDHHRLDRDVKMFFVLNNALMDASVWTWGVKRVYDYVRPISAIHHLYADSSVTAWAGAGMGTQAMAGAQWKPYQAATVVTPPFAEYVSGHRTFSAASATACACSSAATASAAR
jgi:hypothetical protein